MTGPPDFADRVYRLILRWYPPEYRDTFGDEMYETFLDGLSEAKTQGGFGLFLLREMYDAPKVLVQAYWNGWKLRLQSKLQILQQVASTSGLPPAPPDGRDSLRQVLLECIPFMITGLLLILATYFPFDGLDTGWQRNHEFLSTFIVPLTLPVFLLGLARGLPRWAYPFGGMLLSWYGFIALEGTLWFFLVSLLFASLLLALAAILTDPQPALLPVVFRRIGQSFSLDWTRISFAVYGAMPLVILMAFDDSHLDNRTPYLALAVLVMTVGALMYCRSRTKPMQMVALIAGMTLAVGCAWLDRGSFAMGMRNWVIISSQADAEDLWLFGLWVQWLFLLSCPMILMVLGGRTNLKRAIQI